MGILITLIIGGIIGWLASIIMKTNAQMGLIANVLVGVVGAAIGNWIAVMLGFAGGGWIMSIIGAVVLIALLKAIGVFK
jgi:uncharacterized membrane protein YeaQ/YmgE (transglycosylase-associated protein family)